MKYQIGQTTSLIILVLLKVVLYLFIIFFSDAVGMSAPQAAGVIHSDFEKGFIRAETVSIF